MAEKLTKEEVEELKRTLVQYDDVVRAVEKIEAAIKNTREIFKFCKDFLTKAIEFSSAMETADVSQVEGQIDLGKNISKEGLDVFIYCSICERVLGTFDGKVAEGSDGITTREGKVYFVCSYCGTETYVCLNVAGIDLRISPRTPLN